MELNKERIRNLKIKIAHKCIEESITVLNHKMDEQYLSEQLFFKKGDIAEHLDDLFISDSNGYSLHQSVKDEIVTLLENREAILGQKEALVSEYKNKFDEMALSLKNNSHRFSDGNPFKTLIPLAVSLHYIYLPIYDEQMMCNRGVLPEVDLEDYYNHFHSLQDLYAEIQEHGMKWTSIDGDINLDQDIEIQIFTSRWGGADIYVIRRTYDGWYCKGGLIYEGPCDKKGIGTFTQSLEHDLVCYPKEGVAYAFETLWKEADSNSMPLFELESRLRDIAKWINAVEKVTHDLQPSWCFYY
ncbi:hypothetical protein [Turicibacter sanguinis]|uniref:hypothetical protein n=1 Tax=Turicibacter sanguinis TaxID=154288 RepID=UPI00399A0FE5